MQGNLIDMLQLHRIQPIRTGLSPSHRVIGEAEVEVVFGTPSRNCEGMGVCMVMDRLPKRTNLICPHALAQLRCLESGIVEMRFPKWSLPEPVAERYFRTTGFYVEEPFRLPLRLMRRWKCENHWIQPGFYPVSELEREWLICFCK